MLKLQAGHCGEMADVRLTLESFASASDLYCANRKGCVHWLITFSDIELAFCCFIDEISLFVLQHHSNVLLPNPVSLETKWTGCFKRSALLTSRLYAVKKVHPDPTSLLEASVLPDSEASHAGHISLEAVREITHASICSKTFQHLKTPYPMDIPYFHEGWILQPRVSVQLKEPLNTANAHTQRRVTQNLIAPQLWFKK